MVSTKPSKDKYKYMSFFILNVIEDTDLIRRTDNFCLINLRVKRGGSLFEAGSEREENGGVTSVRKRCD